MSQFAWADTDLAPVCLFRAVYGALLVLWFLRLAPNLHAFFSNTGMLPRAGNLGLDAGRFSLLNVVAYDWQLWLFWLASLGVAFMLAAGYRTRLVCVLALIAVQSFESRNPLILDGSDFVYRLTAFWLIFTAAGDRYSVDTWLRARAGKAPQTRGPAFPIVILKLQLAWIYLATALDKVTGPSWINGTALAYVWQLSHTYARPFVAPLASSSLLVHLATWGTLSIEIQFFFVVFLGVLGARAKLAIIAGAALLHLGILMTMDVGDFPLIMLAALVVFVPTVVAEGIAGYFAQTSRRSRGVSLAMWLRMSAVSEVRYGRSVAASHWPAIGRHAPTMLRSSRSGDQVEGVFRGAWRTAWRLAQWTTLAMVAIGALSTSLPTWLAVLHPPDAVDQALAFAGLKQQWDMFAPDPTRLDGWIKAPGWREDGTRIDVVHGGPPSDAPRFANPWYSRWRKIDERIANDDYAGYRMDLASMYCRSYNDSRPAERPRLATFELVSVDRAVGSPNVGVPVMTDRLIWTQAC